MTDLHAIEKHGAVEPDRPAGTRYRLTLGDVRQESRVAEPLKTWVAHPALSGRLPIALREARPKSHRVQVHRASIVPSSGAYASRAAGSEVEFGRERLRDEWDR